jgi:hypothetical protein
MRMPEQPEMAGWVAEKRPVAHESGEWAGK